MREERRRKRDMKKKGLIQIGMGVCVALALSMCTHPYGSVSQEAVAEALRSERLAITPRIPGWLLEKRQIYPLEAAQISRVREILRPEKVRQVDEKFYRSETQGNRNDNTSRIFYLYAGNGQSLGGRVIGQHALMDDFDLSEQETAELYSMFHPVLTKLYPDL